MRMLKFRFKAVIGQIALVGGIAGAAMAPLIASAQTAQGPAIGNVKVASAAGVDELTEIVVTGTSLRGVPQAGANEFSSCWRPFRSSTPLVLCRSHNPAASS